MSQDLLQQNWLSYMEMTPAVKDDGKCPTVVLASKAHSAGVSLSPVQGPPVGLVAEYWPKSRTGVTTESRTEYRPESNAVALVLQKSIGQAAVSANAIARATAELHFQDPAGPILTFMNHLLELSDKPGKGYAAMAQTLQKAYESGYMHVVRKGDVHYATMRMETRVLRSDLKVVLDSDDDADLFASDSDNWGKRAPDARLIRRRRHMKARKMPDTVYDSQSDSGSPARNGASTNKSVERLQKAGIPTSHHLLVYAPLLGPPIMSNTTQHLIGELCHQLQALGLKTAEMHQEHDKGYILSYINSLTVGQVFRAADERAAGGKARKGNVEQQGKWLLKVYVDAYRLENAIRSKAVVEAITNRGIWDKRMLAVREGRGNRSQSSSSCSSSSSSSGSGGNSSGNDSGRSVSRSAKQG